MFPFSYFVENRPLDLYNDSAGLKILSVFFQNVNFTRLCLGLFNDTETTGLNTWFSQIDVYLEYLKRTIYDILRIYLEYAKNRLRMLRLYFRL